MTLLNVDDNSVTKILWARVKPRMYELFTTYSGNVKYVSTSEFVIDIEFDKIEGITSSRQTSLAALNSNGKWFWDRENNKVYFYYNGSDTYITLVIGLFFNTYVDTLALSNFDGDAFDDLTVYEGRLRETSFAQSCEDILSGKLGIYSTSISIINSDSKYNVYAKDNISFKNASVKIWLSINDVDNRIVMFNGLCETASFQKSMILQIIESTKALQQESSFGDSRSWSTINATRWPDSKEEDRYKLIPFFLSNTTKKIAKTTKNAFFNGTTYDVIKNYSYFDVDPDYDLKLKYCGSQAAGIYEEGKKFIVCRTIMNEFPQNFHRFDNPSLTPVLIDNIDDSDISLKQYYSTDYGEFSVNALSMNINRISFLYAGMLVYMRDLTSATFYRMIVTFVDTTSNKFGIRHFEGNKSMPNIIVSGHSYQLHYCGPTIYTVVDGVPVYLDTSNYYFMQDTTDGGNSVIYAVINYQNLPYPFSLQYGYIGNLKSGWKLYLSGSGWTLNDVPDLEYYCRFLNFKVVSDMSTMNIAKTLNVSLRKIKEIQTDSSSDTIVSGNSFYDFYQKTGAEKYIDIISPESVDSIMSENNDIQNETYLDITEKILSSTMSFLCMNNEGKLIVRMFEKEPYGQATLALTEDDIILGSVSSDIDFSEIASTIDANPEYSQDAGVFSESEQTRRICGEIKYNFKHYLKSSSDYSAIVKDRLESYKLVPIKRYNFTIINKGYELTLGDKITIQLTDSGRWLGSDTVKDLFVVAIIKSLNGVQVTCIENNFSET